MSRGGSATVYFIGVPPAGYKDIKSKRNYLCVYYTVYYKEGLAVRIVIIHILLSQAWDMIGADPWLDGSTG